MGKWWSLCRTRTTLILDVTMDLCFYCLARFALLVGGKVWKILFFSNTRKKSGQEKIKDLFYGLVSFFLFFLNFLVDSLNTQKYLIKNKHTSLFCCCLVYWRSAEKQQRDGALKIYKLRVNCDIIWLQGLGGWSFIYLWWSYKNFRVYWAKDK